MMETALSDFVGQQVRQIMNENGQCGPADLRRIWRHLSLENVGIDDRYDLFEEIFLEGSSSEHGGAELALRPGGWTVKISEGILKGSLTAAILGTILAAAGFPALPALVLPAVFPLLFDLEKVRLTMKEKQVLAALTLRDEARTGQPPSKLYQLLPATMRRQLSFLDFSDFLEKCQRAGLADQHLMTGVSLRPVGEAAFRVTIL